MECLVASLSGSRLLDTFRNIRTLGSREYELTDHLGNVIVTFLDRKTGYGAVNGLYRGFSADANSVNDYFPYGQLMNGRSLESSYYRFSHNTQERTDEIAGKGNHHTALFWEYSPQIARRWNVDPVVKSWESSYATFSSNPIIMVDPKGDDARVAKKPNESGKGGHISISTKIHAKGGTAEERAEFVKNGNAQVDFMKKSGKMNGKYKDENGGMWNISLNIEYVDEGVTFHDGDNTMDLSKLNTPGTDRSSVSSKDVQEVVLQNGKWRPTGNYSLINPAGNKGEIRGGRNGLNGYNVYHESMHFVGLSDRYETTTMEAHPGYSSDVMSYKGYDFNQNHWNNWGKAVLSNPDSKFILRQRVDIRGAEQKVMLPENHPTKNGGR